MHYHTVKTRLTSDERPGRLSCLFVFIFYNGGYRLESWVDIINSTNFYNIPKLIECRLAVKHKGFPEAQALGQGPPGSTVFGADHGTDGL